MKSGMLAAESIVEHLLSETATNTAGFEPSSYEERVKSSFIWKELQSIRNVRPSFHTSLGLYGGLVGSGFSIMTGGREPWTLSHGAPDYSRLKKASEVTKIEYPKPDNKITFDLLSSVALTGTNHEGTFKQIYI